MSFPDPAGPVIPEDASLYARMVRHDLRVLGFRPRSRPKHIGLAVLAGMALLVLLVFVYGAFFAPVEQEPESPGSRFATLTAGE